MELLHGYSQDLNLKILTHDWVSFLVDLRSVTGSLGERFNNIFINSSYLFGLEKKIEKLSITFTSNGKHEFVPRDQVSS